MSFRSEVSYSELMYYRNEEKLSNKEIAKRLGVSYQTILNLIGKEKPSKEDSQQKHIH